MTEPVALEFSPTDPQTALALRQRKADLVAAWRERVFSGFPNDAVGFLKGEADPFRNPLGHRIRVATEQMLEVLTGDTAMDDAGEAIDAFVRARALQGHAASTTLRFVFDLKPVVRQVLGRQLAEGQLAGLDERIDALALVAFDVYTRCRDEVHDIRMRAERRRVATLIKRFAPIEEPEPIESEVQG